jgi:hypothetical protein
MRRLVDTEFSNAGCGVRSLESKRLVDTETAVRGSCGHQWDGPWEYEKDCPAGVIMASVTCSKCGISILDYEGAMN